MVGLTDAEALPHTIGDLASGRVIDFLGADVFRSAIDAVVVVSMVGHCSPPRNGAISSMRRARAR
jgi:hypothetical protein